MVGKREFESIMRSDDFIFFLIRCKCKPFGHLQVVTQKMIEILFINHNKG